MYYNKFFPFLTKSPQVDANTRVVNVNDLFLPSPYDEEGKDLRIENFSYSANRFMLNKKPKVLKILPLGIYIMFEPAAVVRYYKKITGYLMCDVIDVDYSVVAKKIELVSNNGEDEMDFTDGTARYPGGMGGETSEDIVDAKYIIAAENGESIYVEIGTKDYILQRPDAVSDPASTSYVPTEDMALKNRIETSLGFQNKPPAFEIDSGTIDALSSAPASATDISKTQTPLEIRLENYITSSYVTERVPMLLGGTATAKCLDPHTRICTERGYIYIKDVVVGDVVYTKNGKRFVINKWSTEKTEGLEIKGMNGQSIKCSNEHKLFVYDSLVADIIEKEAKDITRNDFLMRVFQRPDYVEIEREFNQGYFIGLYLGDGSRNIRKGEYFRSRLIAHKVSGLETVVDKLLIDLKIENYRCFCPSKQCYQWDFKYDLLEDVKMKTSKDKFIPEFVFNSYSMMRGVLCGLLDTDGSLTKRDGEFSITLKSKELIYGIVSILEAFGRSYKIRLKVNKVYGEYYCLKMQNNGNNLKGLFKGSVKQALNFDFRKDSFYVPYSIVLQEKLKDYMHLEVRTRKWCQENASLKAAALLGRSVSIDVLRKIGLVNFPKEMVELVRIESVNRFKTDYMVDLTIDSEESFIANGFASHNSATIKALAEKHGMRLVDLRTAFMDRLDLEGLAEIIQVGGKMESYNATMEQFVQCSDAYIRFCKEAVAKIAEKIAEAEKDKDYPLDKLILLKESFKNYKEGAKVPILFFDEVTRCKPEIRNCLTKILNEKSFNFMDMKMCRIVAAANVPLGLPEELESLYIGGDEVKDVAFLDRFEPLPVTPESMHSTWIKWAKTVGKPKERTNIHKFVLEYIGEDLVKTFNNQPIVDAYNVDYDMDDVTTTPFPNFRAWEMITDYLYQMEDQGKKGINQFVIDGLIGKSDSEAFVSFLVEKGYSEKKEVENKDKLDSIVEEGMLCNIPTMLIGPSGLGKTTKVRNIAKKYNAEFIQINLARSDSTDIMGMPCKIDLTERIGGKMEDIDKDLAKDLKGMVANFDLPAEVTIKAPRSNIKGRFEKAYREGRYVILFFDELNRVTDESLMSAVFEAVSDNRIFGIDFNPARVKIFAACNLGENTPDAGRLDPAFTARFCLYRKKVYDLDDVDSILEFVENEGYDPILLKYLKDMPKDKFLTMVQEIEARTIKKSVPSTRALKDLNGMIGTVKSDPIMGGTILFPNRNFTAIYSELFSVGTLTEVRDVLINLDSKIFPRMPNWSGLDSNITQNFEIVAGKMKNADAKELISWYKDLKGLVFQGGEITPEVEKNIKAMKYVVAQIYAIDLEIKKKRETVTEYIIGDQSADFMSFYNSYSGTMIVQLKIKDLKDINNVTPFLEQQAVTVEATGILTLFTDLVMEFLKEFKDSLSKEHYQTFIKEMIRISTTRESAQALVEGIIRDLSADKIFVYAQDEKFVFTKAIMDAIQLPVSDEEIEAMTQKKKVAAPKAKIL